MPLVVYKLGGSLLDLPDWAARLRRLWGERPVDERRLLVVGGGPATDLVRQWDRRFSLGEAISHRLALGALRLTEQLAAEQFLGFRSLFRTAEMLEMAPGESAIVSAEPFLKLLSKERAIPECWEFTTDSIAGCVATVTGADELVLLKSGFPKSGTTPAEWVADGFVDPCFPEWSSAVPRLTVVNLRGPGIAGGSTRFPEVRVR